jgi:hypothetical protein
MHVNILKPFVFILAVMAVVSLACSRGSGTPVPEPTPVVAPTQPPVQQPTPQEAVVEQPTQAPDTASSDFFAFTDQNNLYTIEVPGDWKHDQTFDTENNYYYIDTFTSPDEGAVVENIVYDDGTAFSGNQKSKFSLYLLNTFYSSTGKEGDIKISDDSIMKDGSERLTWTSKGGGYSGISFLEVRSNGTTFLFFTVDWGNDVEDTYRDILEHVIESYTIP